MYATLLGRADPSLTCQVLLQPDEWRALYCRANRTSKPPATPPLLGEVVLWIAKLGGYLNRKHDRPPGPTVMWRGFFVLHETAEGQKYYLHVPEVVATAKSRVTPPADFCAAKLSLDKVVGWERPMKMEGKMATSVVYTYKIDPVPWAKNADAQRVFPMVKRVIEGAGTMQLREGVHLTDQGWVADEVFQR